MMEQRVDTETAISKAMERFKQGEYNEALGLLEERARSGNPELFALMGKMMEGDHEREPNCERAIAYYREGIERGDRRVSPVRLARLYLIGECAEHNPNKARELFLIGEQEGECLGSFGLGLTYTRHAQNMDDYKKGRAAYLRALRCGNFLAIGLIGESYQREGRWLTGLFIRMVGATVTLPLIVFLPKSRFVRTL